SSDVCSSDLRARRRPDGTRRLPGHCALRSRADADRGRSAGGAVMKILIAAPQPFYQERGTPIAVKLLAESLCELGHEVDLLVYHAGSDIERPGLRLIRAARPWGVRRVPLGPSWQKLPCDAMLIAKMIGLLWRNRYDVVHAVEEAVFPAALLVACGNAFARRRRDGAGRPRAKLVYDMDSSLSDQLIEKWARLKALRSM